MRLYLLLIFSFFTIECYSQTIQNATINIGGGNYFQGNYQFEWSIGESSSIETFQKSFGYIITTGVLQPFTDRVEINNFLTTTWASDEIAIYPIPTHNILQIDLKIRENGPVSIKLTDNTGRLVFQKTVYYTISNGLRKLDLTGLVPGTYYLHVVLEGNLFAPVIRKGTFKIMKL